MESVLGDRGRRQYPAIRLASFADRVYNAAMVEVHRPKPVVLCVLDGWGQRADSDHNAIAQARTPQLDRLFETCPHSLLNASSADVGLPRDQMGNSEVGHMNLGAGRVVVQDLPRVDAAIDDESLFHSDAFNDFVGNVRTRGGTCHILGLVSPGGVHAHQAHIAAFARRAAAAGVNVAVHAFLDGRDTPPKSAKDYVAALSAEIGGDTNIAIATVSGRYFAMDRDQRWDRVARAYEVITGGVGQHADDALAAITAAYAAGLTDEFVEPTAIGGYSGMAAGDGLVMMNFRSDRAREILAALVDPAFDGFARKSTVDFSAALGLVSYSSELDRYLTTLLPPQQLAASLGEVLAATGLTQLRIAETEKYAHVTFFFNGGLEEPFPGEVRILVPSPKVATYDLKPEMSAFEVTDRLVEAIENGGFDFILVNYANTDMVGHTGDLDAAITAVEAVDRCIGRLVAATEQVGGTLVITADHGNAERMFDPATGQAHTAHTTELVPCILVNPPVPRASLRPGRLADVAPTVLAMLGLAQPDEMTGTSLLDASVSGTAAEQQAIA